jgi:hypothetical protein
MTTDEGWGKSMVASLEKFKQVQVSLPGPLLGFIERAASESDRTLSGQIRFLLLESARRLGADLNGAPPAPPPLLLEPNPAALAEARLKLVGLQEEAARLRARVTDPNAQWSAATEQHYVHLQAEIRRLEFEIAHAEHLMPRAASA